MCSPTHTHTHTHTAFFCCYVCKDTKTVEIDRGRIAEPAVCPHCQSLHSMALIHNRSLFTDKQMIKLQESPGQKPHHPHPSPPLSLTTFTPHHLHLFILPLLSAQFPHPYTWPDYCTTPSSPHSLTILTTLTTLIPSPPLQTICHQVRHPTLLCSMHTTILWIASSQGTGMHYNYVVYAS